MTDYMTQQTEDLKTPLSNGHAKGVTKEAPQVNGCMKNVGHGVEFPCPGVEHVDFSSAMLPNMDLARIKVRERPEDAMSQDFAVSLLIPVSKA